MIKVSIVNSYKGAKFLIDSLTKVDIAAELQNSA